MDEPSTTPIATPRTPWVRLVGLIVVLIVLNIAMSYGPIWVLQRYPNIPVTLIRFALSLSLALPIVAALWLTWGGGSIAVRLPLALAVVAIALALQQWVLITHWTPHDHAFQMFLNTLMTLYLGILTLHALMMPIRGYCGWQFSFGPPPISQFRKGARWTLFDIIGFTAFAAFPIAFFRLIDLWSNAFEGRSREPMVWLSLAMQMLLPLLPAVAVSYLWFFPEQPWRRRITAVVLSFAAVLLLLYGYHQLQATGRITFIDCFAAALGMTVAAFINLGIIRQFGVRKYG